MNTKLFISMICIALGVSFVHTSAIAQNTARKADTPAYNQQQIDVIKRMNTAFKTGQWKNLKENMTGDFYAFGIDSRLDSMSVDELVGYWTEARKSYSVKDMSEGYWNTISVKEGPTKGDWVFHWSDMTLRYPQADKDVWFPYHIAYKMEGNKAKRAYFYYDTNLIMKQLGYTQTPPIMPTEKE